tara:strand:- start:7519 stop:7803 length:285 start_codon:yes stop_codon:yes gene_type:complete
MNKEQTLKVLLWAVPVIFGAGGFYSMVGATSASLTEKVAEIEVEVEEHVALEAHPVTKTRLDIIVEEQREMRDELKSQSASLAAICQATGAQCR